MSRRELVVPDYGLRRLARGKVAEVLTKAYDSERRRAMVNLGAPEDQTQKLVNCILDGSYIQAHVHNGEHPKWESFTLLYGGPLGVFTFMSDGRIAGVELLTLDDLRTIIIEPNIYHCAMALEPSVVLEVLDQPYDESTHKKMASWGPSEDASPDKIIQHMGKLRSYMIARNVRA
jgi:cupin fold WbuC family metalloprotein